MKYEDFLLWAQWRWKANDAAINFLCYDKVPSCLLKVSPVKQSALAV